MPFNGFLYKNQDFSRDFLRLTFPGVIQYHSEIQTAKHTTRCPTLKDLGAGRLYWAVSVVWVVAVTLSVYVWFTEPADRAAALIFGSIFAFFLLAMVLYPLLRIREPDTVCVSRTTYNSREIKGIYIPTSKVALSIYTFGSLALSVLTLLGSFFADTAEHRAKAFICTAFYGTVFVLTSVSGLSRKRGIFITQEGVFWSGLIHACFVPWEQITFVGLVQKKEQYTTSTELGLTVKNLDSIRASKFTKNKLIENWKRHGWHLSYGRDLRAPLAWLSEKIQFYLQNPARRLELENPETAAILLKSLWASDESQTAIV